MKVKHKVKHKVKSQGLRVPLCRQAEVKCQYLLEQSVDRIGDVLTNGPFLFDLIESEIHSESSQTKSGPVPGKSSLSILSYTIKIHMLQASGIAVIQFVPLGKKEAKGEKIGRCMVTVISKMSSCLCNVSDCFSCMKAASMGMAVFDIKPAIRYNTNPK